jgi:hypothetical protein
VELSYVMETIGATSSALKGLGAALNSAGSREQPNRPGKRTQSPDQPPALPIRIAGRGWVVGDQQ